MMPLIVRRGVVVLALGTTQTLAWASSYYRGQVHIGGKTRVKLVAGKHGCCLTERLGTIGML